MSQDDISRERQRREGTRAREDVVVMALGFAIMRERAGKAGAATAVRDFAKFLETGISPELPSLAEIIRSKLLVLGEDERISVLGGLGICLRCGADVPRGRCSCSRCGVVLLPPSGAAALPRCPDPRDHAAGCSCRRCYYGVDE